MCSGLASSTPTGAEPVVTAAPDAPDARRHPARFPLLLVTGIGTFAAGVLLVWTGSGASDNETEWFDAYRAWAVLVGVFVTVASFVALSMAGRLRTLWTGHRDALRMWVTAIVGGAYLLFAVGPAGARRLAPGGFAADLPDQIGSLSTRIFVVNTAGALLFLPGVIVLDWARQIAESGRAEFVSGDRFDVERFVQVRRTVDSAVVEAGSVFAIALVATSALRAAILDADGRFSQLQLLLFGVQFTGLLVVLYWPVQSGLNAVARRARDDAVPLPSLREPDLAERARTRAAIDALLGAAGTPLEGFRTRIALVAPLLTSLVTSVVTST